MHRPTLDRLRCPFCGTRFTLVDNAARRETEDRIEAGVLGCECCAFPIVDGIPILRADEVTRAAMHALEAGSPRQARHRLLGLDAAGAERFDALTAGARGPTYRELLAVLCTDAEADYFLYRFSDPTFRLAEAVVGSVTDRLATRAAPHARAPRLDLCGGSGHLARLLTTASGPPIVVADVHYWKLWLAARYTAPGCEPICCDVNNPLPFAATQFDLVLLADAFPYVWQKRLCAGEMARVATRGGVVVMPHLHNALGDNPTAGAPLTPAAYRDLWAPMAARLFDDARLLDTLLDRHIMDLTGDATPAELGSTPSLTLVAGGDPGVFRRQPVADPPAPRGVLAVNPLYRVEHAAGRSRLTLRFPTDAYADEYAAALRYLPRELTVDGDLRGPLSLETLGDRAGELRWRAVVLDLPRGYV